MELDTYLKTLKKEKSVWLEEDIKPAAKKRLERSLVLDKLAKEEKVEIKNEDLQQEYTQMISEMQQTTDFKKLEKQLRNERVANAVAMEAASRVLNRQVLNRLKDIATGKVDEKIAEPVAEDKKPKPVSRTAKSKKVAGDVETNVEVTQDKTVKKPAKKVVKTGDK
jgi:trigger factor